MNYVLTQAFADDVAERLDTYDDLARQGDNASLTQLAPGGILLLTAALRTLLAQHQVDSHGHCKACPRKWWQNRTRCQAARDLSALLIDPAILNSAPGRHALLREPGLPI
ncbi:hypothetical protein [Amycolatopsis orientalis]|uniref:hypothetical protein n=1 Tax=Amycolatopsis orientalis TaxID=31958 RepID=UPI000565E879|nr:hypothetical protein [Amycolatopsis orientalis]